MHIIKTLLVSALLPLAVAGQKPLPRPALPAGADANDPSDYIRYASGVIEGSPGKAEQAYYWAARLAPGSADALYGRHIAHLLADRRLLIRWMQADARAMRSKELQEVDSLRLAYGTADPFLFGIYDRMLIMTFLTELVDQELRRTGNTSATDRSMMEYELGNYLRRLGPAMNAWLAYLDRNFSEALSFYDSALKNTKDRAGLHASKAQVFYHTGRYDEAIGALKSAVDERSRMEKDKLVHIYESQATYEYMMGRAYEAAKDLPNAREAYARALLSDLSYYPAHLRLSNIAMVSGDTAAALNALQTAVDIQSGNGWVRSLYGTALLSAGKLDEAATQLKQATVLEPFFASPHYYLGRAYDLRGDKPSAVSWYRQFLERANQRHDQRAAAESRLRELGT